MAKIGIPQALLYYYYFPMWKSFFENLGHEVVVSSRTTKGILNQGARQAVDEACLPVKLYYGHVFDLKDKVDYLFIPRLVSVENRAYICPKFLGLPDMIQHSSNDLPPIISTTIDMSKKYRNLYKAVHDVGKTFTNNPFKIYRAYKAGINSLNTFKQLIAQGLFPHEALKEMDKGLIAQKKMSDASKTKLTIALVGHPYNLYDPYISMNLINKLRQMGVKVVSSDNLTELQVDNYANKLPKKLFWTLGKRMIGSAFYFLEQKNIDGIIHVSAFGCGLDSVTGELIERKIKRHGLIPYLSLTIDEHTGEAGVVTRLEAFIDMIRWRTEHENNVSTHG